jgi:hypothetical protein
MKGRQFDAELVWIAGLDGGDEHGGEVEGMKI